MKVPSYLLASATAALLVLAPLASAHVTLQPEEIPAGGFTRLDVRIPTERDDASTTKVEVQFTANGEAAGIGPGEFQDFGLSLSVPDKAGSTLTFKAVQTYSSGEVVRWIGSPHSEQPPPQGEPPPGP